MSWYTKSWNASSRRKIVFELRFKPGRTRLLVVTSFPHLKSGREWSAL